MKKRSISLLAVTALLLTMMTRYVIRYLLDNCPDELAFFNQFFDKGLILSLIHIWQTASPPCWMVMRTPL